MSTNAMPAVRCVRHRTPLSSARRKNSCLETVICHQRAISAQADGSNGMPDKPTMGVSSPRARFPVVLSHTVRGIKTPFGATMPDDK
jgi:hypothetical protein